MIHAYYFSATNTTETIVKSVIKNIGIAGLYNNITSATADVNTDIPQGDIVLLASPVYGGRIPDIAAERFKRIKGNGQKCIVLAVYGNRDYDDALLELCDLATENGFTVVAAGVFVAQHCIFPTVAKSRPDSSDLERIADFASNVHAAIENDAKLDISTVKGNRPYKAYNGVPLHPEVNNKKCSSCGRCIRECPVGATNPVNPYETDTDKCISCCRCIDVCPDKARSFGGLKYKALAPIFKAKFSKRKEPEWFIAQ